MVRLHRSSDQTNTHGNDDHWPELFEINDIKEVVGERDQADGYKGDPKDQTRVAAAV
jgi:hypothetical protein